MGPPYNFSSSYAPVLNMETCHLAISLILLGSLPSFTHVGWEISLLENVEHCGGEPEQADTACLLANRNAWVPGGGLYVLCVVCPLVLGCQGKACLSTCCLSHGEPLGEGMSVECGYIGMN